MEVQRQVLLVTWAFLLTLHAAVVHADVINEPSQGTSEKNDVDIVRWLSYLYDKYLYLVDGTTITEPSLLKVKASCLGMEFWALNDKEKTAKLLVTYKDESSEWKTDILNVTAKLREGESNYTLSFTFYEVETQEHNERSVDYKLLSTDYTTCSILKTTGNNKCSFWVLYIGDETYSADKCKPQETESEQCNVEVYTREEPEGCKAQDEDSNKEENAQAPK